jgi:hypothetical protein
MTITDLMQTRAAIDATIAETPIDVSIEDSFGRKWVVEQAILSCTALTVDDLKAQIKILAGRARDGLDVADELARLAD